jgi:uncharacterized Zn-finger protein
MTANAATPASQKPLEVTESQVACDGGGGALGHPLVYLTVGQEGRVDCPYCSRRYVLSETAKVGGHGH